MTAEHTRRAADRHTLNIDSMIAEENDPKQRAFLIVLNSINNSLVANTSTIKEVSTKLETHLNNYETTSAIENELLNKGRGAWKVMAWVLGVIQTLVVFVGLEIRSDLAGLHAQANAIETRMTVMEKKP